MFSPSQKGHFESPGVNSCHESLLLLLLSRNCWSWVGRCDLPFPLYRGFPRWFLGASFGAPLPGFWIRGGRRSETTLSQKGVESGFGMGGGWSSMKKSLGRKPISQWSLKRPSFCLVSMQNHKWHKSKTMWLQLQANTTARINVILLSSKGRAWQLRRYSIPTSTWPNLPLSGLETWHAAVCSTAFRSSSWESRSFVPSRRSYFSTLNIVAD